MKAVLLAFVALLALAAAAPTVFLGGSFHALDGVVVGDGFGAFNVDTQKWSHYARENTVGDSIVDIAAVRNGTFVTGSFTAVGGSASARVAFFDGVKWCPIRQGLDGPGAAVVCDSDTSCWVAGSFSGIVNLDEQDTIAVKNFAHYVYNTVSGEWEIDTEAFSWNNATGFALPDGVNAGALDFIGSGANLFFFASIDSTIYRGSDADNGWYVLATAASIPAGTINDWSINPEGTSLYVATDVGGNGTSVLTGTRVTGACGTDCQTPTDTNDWSFVVAGGYNVSFFTGNGFTSIVAGSGDTRYLIGQYDPDSSSEGEFDTRWRVFSQSGSAQPVLVGDAFEVNTDDTLKSLWLTETGAPIVVGTFVGANLFYPATPLTTDTSGVVGDRRSLDRAFGAAVFNTSLSRWVQYGGGGFGGNSGTLIFSFNSNTREMFAFDGGFDFVYDLHAVAAAYHDSTPDEFFPVFTRNLETRPVDGGAGQVWEIICTSSACENIFVGGDFAFHGPDTFGAVLHAKVKSSGDPELTTVGGGLWATSVGHYNDDASFQLNNGKVYALTTAGGFLYAGGEFSRTATGSGFHCLSNVARLDTSNLAGQWETLVGGCDGAVYDLQEYSGQMYAAGDFFKCGESIVNYVSSYSFGDEAPAWNSLNNGLDSTAYSLELFQGRIIVGGTFTHAGGLPVGGVAAWDGTKWRALLPACTDDCTPGSFQYYFNVLNTPASVWDLQRDRSGSYLFATASYDGDSVRYLSRWQYTQGDFGQWLVKGQIDYDDVADGKGDAVAIFEDDKLLIANYADETIYADVNQYLGVWDQNAENTNVGPTIVQNTVRVVRGPAGGDAGSAAALSSMLSPLLAYVF